MMSLGNVLFHHWDHRNNASASEADGAIPKIPERWNLIFYVYPLCIMFNAILLVLWLTTKILDTHPEYVSL